MKEPQLPLQRTPQPQPQSQQPQKSLRFVTLGAGSRGTAYAQAVTTTTNGCIHAVADPHAFKRREFGRRFIWGESSPAVGQEFGDWREWVEYEVGRRKRRNHDLEQNDGLRQEGIHGVFICTLDHTHIEIVHSIATNFPDLHILCEKPLALSLDDCLSVYRSLSIPGSQNTRAIFSIGHVLRYSPHNNILRRVVLHDRAIGDIVSLEHTEPVGWWHFAHSYVRGNWRRETLNGDGSLLTKSCHDIDFILWLLCTPSPAQDPNPGPGHGHGPGTETGTAPRTTTHHPPNNNLHRHPNAIHPRQQTPRCNSSQRHKLPLMPIGARVPLQRSKNLPRRTPRAHKPRMARRRHRPRHRRHIHQVRPPTAQKSISSPSCAKTTAPPPCQIARSLRGHGMGGVFTTGIIPSATIRSLPSPGTTPRFPSPVLVLQMQTYALKQPSSI